MEKADQVVNGRDSKTHFQMKLKTSLGTSVFSIYKAVLGPLEVKQQEEGGSILMPLTLCNQY